MIKIPSHSLNLAGEYRVCSELIKRGVFASITYGQHKGADIYAVTGEKAVRIEVKTSQQPKFVTSITQKKLDKSKDAPGFWVLFLLQQVSETEFTERFFILSHKEICRVQRLTNKAYARNYVAKHGRSPDFARGVDNVKLKDVEKYEGDWSKIDKAVSR